jgi:branched-subunit amino acid transport protein AzlD
MKCFFHQTYYFWLITRVIFIVGAVLDSGKLFSKGLDALDMLINVAIIGYLCLMTYNTVNEYRNSFGNSITKYIAGTLSIILGAVIVGIVLTRDSAIIALAAPFAIWIVLLGIFDLLVLNRSEEREELEIE